MGVSPAVVFFKGVNCWFCLTVQKQVFAKEVFQVYASAFEKFRERKAVLREPLIELCDTLALLVSGIT